MMKQHSNKSIPARRTPGQTSSAPAVTHRNTGEKSTTDGRTLDHHRAKDKIVIGTWNVETLWRDGRLEELCHELKDYKWNVIGLSEVRKVGFGETKSDDNHTLYHCGKDKHEHGVGILVHKDTAKFVMGCNYISSRLISIRIKASPFNITVFQAYAPTTQYSDEDIEIFYQELQENIDTSYKNI